MNQEKVGKFIAELRKEKGITQEELAKEFGITSQSISKWERGVNLPDISLLQDLSKKLEVSIEELLLGERKSSNKKENNEDFFVSSIQFYENRAKNKVLKKSLFLFVVLIFIIAFISSIYFINNYNKIKIYKLTSDEENFSINGRIIFNPQKRIISVNGIMYNDKYVGTDKEIEAKNVVLKLKANDRIIFETGSLDYDENEILHKLNYYLDQIEVDYSQSNEESNLKESYLDNCIIEISYIDSNDEIQVVEFNLRFEEEFTNNIFFYN